MLFNTEIDLISTTRTANDIGDAVETETVRTVMADKQSIRQSEFYQAAAAGLKPLLMFLVMSAEYQGETVLGYDGKRYHIARTYERPDERTELVCTGLVVG